MSWTPLLQAHPALEPLIGLMEQRLGPAGHGDMPRWLAALAALPDVEPTHCAFGPTVTLDAPLGAADRLRLDAQLQQLRPWRKGPFSLFGVAIDTEWRSDWKWQRLAPHLAPLDGAHVLDVGCGNGYFGWRMLDAGAERVVGVDPTLLFCLQHRAVNRYVRSDANWVLPLRFEEFPAAAAAEGFDHVFSMGVIYHRRDPAEHARQLFRCTRPGGQVIVESLVVRDRPPLIPTDRYARMRNVWCVPDRALLEHWLASAGFGEVRTVDVTPTTTDEQRSTAWMPFESLAAALDAEHPDRTVEGHPAPVRAIVTARKQV